jgi:peptide/nickel transport system permease protein
VPTPSPSIDESVPQIETAPAAPDASGRPGNRAAFARYLVGKIAAAIISFAVLLVAGFLLFNEIPSDPVRTATKGRPVDAAQLAELRRQFGVGLPLWHKFTNYADNVGHLRLGYSYTYHQSVASLIGERIWPTVLLTGTATIISVVLGLWLGIRAGWRAGSLFDRIASGTSITLWSVPTFWLGLILLVVLGVGVGPIPGIFPAGGMSTPGLSGNWLDHALDVAKHLFLPALTLVLVVFAQYVTIMRSSIIDELGTPYLLTARAKGLRDDVVRRHHAVPNALLPSVTVIFLQLGGVIGGAITVETVFSWPGLGFLTYQALQIPDTQILEGTFLIFSASVIVMNLLADLLYRALDPRVRAQ